jgi:hypothetical protein
VGSNGTHFFNIYTLLRVEFQIIISSDFEPQRSIIINITLTKFGLLLSTRKWPNPYVEINNENNSDFEDKINILKRMMVQMYQQHPIAFEKFTRNYSAVKDDLNEQMKLFYNNIIDDVVNPSYGLK